MRSLSASSLLSITCLLAACQESDLVVIAPQIAVDVCAAPRVEVAGELIGGVRDCAVTFDAQPMTVRTRREVSIANPSPIDLVIEDVSFTADSDPAFAVETMPDFVAAGQTAVGVISYRPLVEGTQRAQLEIESDAENLRPSENVVIDLEGTSFDDGAPDIVVTPEACDYGAVAVGGAAVCDVSIENRGQRDLVFDGVKLDGAELVVPPETDPEVEVFGFAGRPPARDDALAAAVDGSSVASVSVRFLPTALGDYAGALLIGSNDPDTPLLRVPLSAVGVTPPTCAISIKSVNGIDVSATPAVEPLDDVVLTAAASAPAREGGEIVSVRWRILEAPGGSTATLDSPNALETGFAFANGVRGLDLAGRWVVAAEVTDELGTESVNDCKIEFDAVPSDTILAQLTWDTSFGDMDLHLIKADDGGRFCSAQSFDGALSESCGTQDFACYYGNCKASAGARPDWDGDGTAGSDGDPSLDIDDLCGFGPENINIDLAEPGEYLVAVDFFGFTGCSGNGSTGNTVRLYLFGQLHAEHFRDMDDGDWWEVAVIHWPGVDNGSPCVEDLSTPEAECG
jgi:hypothetical protein